MAGEAWYKLPLHSKTLVNQEVSLVTWSRGEGWKQSPLERQPQERRNRRTATEIDKDYAVWAIA